MTHTVFIDIYKWFSYLEPNFEWISNCLQLLRLMKPDEPLGGSRPPWRSPLYRRGGPPAREPSAEGAGYRGAVAWQWREGGWHPQNGGNLWASWGNLRWRLREVERKIVFLKLGFFFPRRFVQSIFPKICCRMQILLHLHDISYFLYSTYIYLTSSTSHTSATLSTSTSSTGAQH